MKFIVNPDEDDPEKVSAVIYFWTGQPTNSINPERNKLSEQKTDGEKKKYCNNSDCPNAVSKAEIAFCLNNKDRFNGRVYCRECQENK